MGGGAAGTSFAGPQQANIQQAVNTGQTGQLYNQNQASLAQQQALLQALQGQNGIQNQNAALQGLQSTAQQFQNLANGVGPNPAQAQLAQNTASNVAQTGALMAGQRGASQNVGLLARQAGQAGAQAQQNAVGQAATLQAQQQLAGLQGLQGAQTAAGNIAGQQVSNTLGQTNTITGAQQAEQANLLNALGAYNQAQVGSQGNVNQANASLANTQMGGQQSLLGGALQGIGLGGYTAGSAAHGGQIMKMADGGAVGGPQSAIGQFLQSYQAGVMAPGPMQAPQISMEGASPNKQLQQGASAATRQALTGPSQPPTVGASAAGNAGATDLPGLAIQGAELAAKGGGIDYRAGGKIAANNSAQKAVKSGDSYSNDKIPIVVSEKEIVLPRSVTMSKDPVNASAKFVAAVLAKRGKK